MDAGTRPVALIIGTDVAVILAEAAIGLEFARGRAAIAGIRVSVITLLTRLDYAVAAGGKRRTRAVGPACVRARFRIWPVTLFISNPDSIPAHRNSAPDALPPTATLLAGLLVRPLTRTLVLVEGALLSLFALLASCLAMFVIARLLRLLVLFLEGFVAGLLLLEHWSAELWAESFRHPLLSGALSPIPPGWRTKYGKSDCASSDREPAVVRRESQVRYVSACE